MRATFPKTDEHGRRARFEWPDGFVATTPTWNHRKRLPHDLEHYAVEAVLRPRYGFWTLAAQKAPFRSLLPERAWPRDRVNWFRTVLSKHRDEMVEAEILPVLITFAADGAPPRQAWPEARRALARIWSRWPGNPPPDLSADQYERMVELDRELRGRWRDLPDGDSLIVEWPPAG